MDADSWRISSRRTFTAFLTVSNVIINHSEKNCLTRFCWSIWGMAYRTTLVSVSVVHINPESSNVSNLKVLENYRTQIDFGLKRTHLLPKQSNVTNPDSLPKMVTAASIGIHQASDQGLTKKMPFSFLLCRWSQYNSVIDPSALFSCLLTWS